jgi:hypothetical protein
MLLSSPQTEAKLRKNAPGVRCLSFVWKLLNKRGVLLTQSTVTEGSILIGRIPIKPAGSIKSISPSSSSPNSSKTYHHGLLIWVDKIFMQVLPDRGKEIPHFLNLPVISVANKFCDLSVYFFMHAVCHE